jgi:photosystem II stability/assembly factor-like uncharacterized protein
MWSEPFVYGSKASHEDMTHIGDSVWLLNSSSNQGLRSTDGGKTWDANDVGVAWPRAFSFANSKVGFTVGNLGIGGNAVYSYTIDGGEHWFEKSSGIKVDLYGVFALSPDKVFAVGNRERIYQTTDLGDSWDTLPAPSSIAVYLDIHFSDPNNGSIVGSRGIIKRTTDGGITWSYQESTIQYPKDTNVNLYLNSISFVDSLYGWTVGNNGIALRTRTGGFTTQGVVENPLISISTQIFPEPNNGIARIKYYLPEPQSVVLTLYSMSGQLVKSLVFGDQLAGQNEIVLDLRDLSAGVYQFMLKSSKFTSTGHLTILK